MKQIEIERRFLLKRPPQMLVPTFDIVQYYGTDEIGKYRFRIRREFEDQTDKVEFFLTRKTKLSKGTFEEDEIQVGFESFVERQSQFKSIITKHRYVIDYDGLKFEVDQLTNVNLVILEVELPTIDTPFTFPKELEMEWNLIKEITGDKYLSNRKLSIPII